jgi:hypothetical protein
MSEMNIYLCFFTPHYTASQANTTNANSNGVNFLGNNLGNNQTQQYGTCTRE